MNYSSAFFTVALVAAFVASDATPGGKHLQFPVTVREQIHGKNAELPVFVSKELAVHANHTDFNLDVVSRQDWVQEYGRRACLLANQVRAQYGRHQLYYSASLTHIGARHSNWMAYYNVFTHQNLNGLGVWVGQHWLPATAENIAMSVPRSNDPTWDAHQQWYYSPPHFQNMISPYHTHCGVGIAYDRQGRWWGTQLFGYNTAFGDEGGSGTRAPPAPAPAPAPAPVAAPAAAPAAAPPSSPSDGISVPKMDPNATPRPRDTSAPASPPSSSDPSDTPTSMTGQPLTIDDLSSLSAPSSNSLPSIR